jgi:hypothetical protein
MTKLNHESIYPQEFLVPFETTEGNNDFAVGKITIFQSNLKDYSYHSEIVLVQKESGRILRHLETLFNYDDPQDLLSDSLQKIKNYFYLN